MRGRRSRQRRASLEGKRPKQSVEDGRLEHGLQRRNKDGPRP